MKIQLPTRIDVEVDDKDLLALLKMKRLELLEGADYAEQDEADGKCWLWQNKSPAGVGKPSYEKVKEMELADYKLLESFTETLYLLQQSLQTKTP